MSAIPLKIFVHGLIALVPTTPGHLTALLVDGRMPMTEQCPMEHHPQLSFFVSESADCITVPGCTLSESQCTCKHTTVGAKDLDPLVGKQIFIEVHPDPTFSTDKLASTPPPPPLPVSKDAAGSFSYVANFAQTPFNKTLNPIYLAANPSPAARTYLVARMDVPYGKDMLSGKDNVTACALATREDGGLAYVHSMSFRKLHTQSDAADPGYALAQKVIAVIDVPDAPPGQQVVKLHIRDFDGTNDHAFTLLPGPDAYRINLGNDPDAPLHRDDPCEDGVARHFMHFYDLANEFTKPADQLIPHVRFTDSVEANKVKPDTCNDPIFGLADLPICPMATFNQ